MREERQIEAESERGETARETRRDAMFVKER